MFKFFPRYSSPNASNISRSVVQDQFVLLIGLFEHLFDTLVYGGRTDVYFVDAGDVNVPEQPDMHSRD